MVIPEDSPPTAPGYLLEGGRRSDGLPRLIGIPRARNEREFFDSAPTVWDPGRWEIINLTVERKGLLVERHLDDLHGLVKLLTV